MANLKMRGSAEERELLKNEKGDLGVTLVRSADSREREELFFLFSGLVRCTGVLGQMLGSQYETGRY